MEKYIKCSRCKSLKIADEFGIKKDGDIYKKCINCRENYKKWCLENDDKKKEICKKWYLENADKVKGDKKKWYLENTDKAKEDTKKWRLENLDKAKEICKKYHLENPEKAKEYNKKYRLENPDWSKNYRQNIKLNNPLRHLAILQRQQLRRCLKLTDQTKRKHSIEYLDCDIEYFYNFLKNKMDIWNNANPTNLMTFENIHLDHIKPISVFNFDCEDAEDNLLDCCSYTNIQPLLIKDNLSKHNKWTDENDAYWNENIKGNAEYCDIYLT